MSQEMQTWIIIDIGPVPQELIRIKKIRTESL